MRYRLQRHDGTDCSATMVPITVLRMVPIQRYRQFMAYGILKINNCLYRPPIKKGNKLVINLLPFSICPHDICTFLRFIL